MKKILIMMFVAATATNINAQLVVDSLGHVGIGRETAWPNSILSVGNIIAEEHNMSTFSYIITCP